MGSSRRGSPVPRRLPLLQRGFEPDAADVRQQMLCECENALNVHLDPRVVQLQFGNGQLLV
jgi:hypothetical protein